MRRKAAVAALALALFAAAVISSTGYLNLFREVDDTTRFVPAGADAAVRVNTTAVAGDGTTDRLFDRVAGVGYDEVLASVENRTNLDPGGLREATVFFGEGTTDPSSTYAGVVFHTDWNADDIRDIDGFDVEKRSYNAVPLYAVRSDATEARQFYLTPVARGVYVAGTEEAVRDASDAAFWNGDTFERRASDELTDAPVSFVAPNASPVEAVSVVSGTYRPRTGGTSVAVELRPSEDATVPDVRREVETYLRVGKTLASDRLADVLSRVELSETDKAVVVSHDASVERTAGAFRTLDRRFGWSDRLGARLETYGVSEVLGLRFSDTDRTNRSSQKDAGDE